MLALLASLFVGAGLGWVRAPVVYTFALAAVVGALAVWERRDVLAYAGRKSGAGGRPSALASGLTVAGVYVFLSLLAFLLAGIAYRFVDWLHGH